MARHAFLFLSVGEAAERQLSLPITAKPTVASPPGRAIRRYVAKGTPYATRFVMTGMGDGTDRLLPFPA